MLRPTTRDRAAALAAATILALVAAAACSNDLFHATQWGTVCDTNPKDLACADGGATSGAGGATSATSASSSASSSASATSSAASSSASSATSTSGGHGGCGGGSVYMVTSGVKNGTAQACCKGTDARVGLQDCANGGMPMGAGGNCATETSMTQACVTVSCQPSCM